MILDAVDMVLGAGLGATNAFFLLADHFRNGCVCFVPRALNPDTDAFL
jgi:hypothetical protein